MQKNAAGRASLPEILRTSREHTTQGKREPTGSNDPDGPLTKRIAAVTLDPIVDAHPAVEVGPPGGFYGWDWSATTHDGRDRVVNDLCDALKADLVLPGKGLQGWSQSVQAYDAGGYLIGSVYFGGGRDDVHVVSTSAVADEARAAVVGLDRARTSRVDTRVDSLVPFNELAAIMEEAAQSYGSLITRVESSQRGVSQGRTLYLGAPSSAIRVRLYEKWLESPGQYVEGTNRVEVQLRPASKVKDRVSRWSRAETFCASKVTRELASRLGAELLPAASLHVAKPTPDLERTLQVMGEQYGNAVDKWLSVSGGDLDRVLAHLTARPLD